MMMGAGRLKSVKVDEIHLRDDVVKRAVNSGAVDKLVASISISGLQTPIRVRPVVVYKSGEPFNEWELIAGRHRLEAVKALGWHEIDANTEPLDDTLSEIAMIDENLERTDLEPAEFVYASSRRKTLYEILFPETAHGGDRKSSRNNCDLKEPDPERFTKVTADISGKSERTVQMAVTIGNELGKESLTLVGTSLNSITELDALRRIKDRGERRKLMDRARSGEEVSAKDALKARKPQTQRTGKGNREPANDNTGVPIIEQPESTSNNAPEVAAQIAFFQGGDEGCNHGGGTEPHKPEQLTAPSAPDAYTQDAEEVQQDSIVDIAEDVIERFGRENMPYLLTLLEGNPRKLAAAIRRQLA